MYGNEDKSRELIIVGVYYEESNNYYSSGKIYANSSVLDDLKFNKS